MTIGRGADEEDMALCESSLELIVQNDAVFILSYNMHRLWNAIECQRMLTKGK